MADLLITIDGPAASGKSTVARLLAQKLGASFLDTGAMYRAVTWAAVQTGTDLKDEQKLLTLLGEKKFQFSVKEGQLAVCIDGLDVTQQLRKPQITANARYIASAAKLRDKLVQMQRQFADRHKKVVTEGRDQGTVAFPDAHIKFYLTAQPVERARRRQAQLQAEGHFEGLQQVQKAIERRDRSDRNRTIGPLKPAQDAVIVDSTNLTVEQVVQKLLGCVKQKCSQK